MFTGIIESLGEIKQVQRVSDQVILTVSSRLTTELKVDQSVAHNGVCLTVTSIKGDQYQVCAVQETLDKTTLGSWQSGEQINLERGIKLSDRLDGHIVQGHVDTIGKCIQTTLNGENRDYTFLFDSAFAALIVEKGSIVINGVSLTCFNVTERTFQVTIIPFTYAHTTFSTLKDGDAVNLEFDILGKYFQRHLSLQKS